LISSGTLVCGGIAEDSAISFGHNLIQLRATWMAMAIGLAINLSSAPLG